MTASAARPATPGQPVPSQVTTTSAATASTPGWVRANHVTRQISRRLWLMASPKLEPVVLTDDERQVLEGWARRRKTAQALALRSRIVLACADGRPDQRRWRPAWGCRGRRSASGGRGSWSPAGGAGRRAAARPPRTITDEHVEAVDRHDAGADADERDTHWSTRSMAEATGMSQSAVSRIWRAFGLKPHLVQTFKLSTDPLFIDKVRDVVGLYLIPPEKALVLCVDEKSQIQALDRTQPCLPMLPRRPARKTHDYVRDGTTSLFAALDVATGKVIAQPSPAAPAPGVPEVPQAHRRGRPEGPRPAPGPGQLRHPQDPRDQGVAARHPRFHLHFTPTSSCWLNLVECVPVSYTSFPRRREPRQLSTSTCLVVWVPASAWMTGGSAASRGASAAPAGSGRRCRT